MFKNVIGGGGGGEGRDVFVWFSEICDFIVLWLVYLFVLRESVWEFMFIVVNIGIL